MKENALLGAMYISRGGKGKDYHLDFVKALLFWHFPTDVHVAKNYYGQGAVQGSDRPPPLACMFACGRLIIK